MFRKLALIIGNNDYQPYGLKNCVNDATSLAQLLRNIGCKVELKTNLKSEDTYQCIKKFTETILPNDLVIFFFSGHAVQWGDQNFLLPCDNIKITSGPDMYRYAINAQQNLDQMASMGPHFILFLLDCCREYWLPTTARSISANKQANGLSKMNTPPGTVIAFACAPGRVASDRCEDGNNGIFTKYLLKHLATPNMDIELVLRRVATDVTQATNNAQIPYRVSSAMAGEIHLVSASSPDLNASNIEAPNTDVTQKDSELDVQNIEMKEENEESENKQKEAVAKFRNAIKTDPGPKTTFDEEKGGTQNNNVKNSSQTPPRFHSRKDWLDLTFHANQSELIKKPDQITIEDPPGQVNEDLLARIKGSMIGMALGDALGAHVEFRPHQYLKSNPVTNLQGGGTWGLKKGQFTDDTSMALCLANSLIACGDFVPYDQLVRYKWWYRHGYMSSTGDCFDIENATRQSIVEFQKHQQQLAKNYKITDEQELDNLRHPDINKPEIIYCSEDGVAGNGALMRLAPVPLFFFRAPVAAVEYSGISGKITHGDKKAYDACRYYGVLIVGALHGYTKEKLLDENFYSNHKEWFGSEPLHSDVEGIARGSFKRTKGYDGGIRGKGYILSALEAALWAFWSDEDSFEKGALAAVNLGDDTDTTAAIYGQLAGVYYKYEGLPKHWLKEVYAHKFLEQLSKWIAYEGEEWYKRYQQSTDSKL